MGFECGWETGAIDFTVVIEGLEKILGRECEARLHTCCNVGAQLSCTCTSQQTPTSVPFPPSIAISHKNLNIDIADTGSPGALPVHGGEEIHGGFTRKICISEGRVLRVR